MGRGCVLLYPGSTYGRALFFEEEIHDHFIEACSNTMRLSMAANRVGLILLFVLCGACFSEPEGDVDGCPAGTTFDADSDRCIDDQSSSDDAGFGQTDANNSGSSIHDDTGSVAGSDDAGSNNFGPSGDDVGTGGNDDDTGQQPDTGATTDTGSNGDTDSGSGGGEEDTGPTDPCDGVTCGSNAHCDNGTCYCNDNYQGDPEQECFSVSSCGTDGCDDGQWCDSGQCVCKWGFTASGTGCERDAAPDPTQRSEAEVCSAWNDIPDSFGLQTWQDEPQDQCDWGVLHPEYHNGAMTKLNVYRWLIGMEAADSSQAMRDATQACATFHAAEGGALDHYPSEDTTCYTPEGYDGAASSNLAGGSSAMSAIDLWLSSLGHRRWMLNPTLQNTAFGSHSGYVCLYVTQTGFTDTADFYAYPSPGYFPRSAIVGQWMVTSSSWGLNDNVDVEVTRVSDNESLTVQVGTYYWADMSRPASLVFQPAGVTSGETYEVRLSNLTGSQDERSYEVTLVDC